MTATGKMFRFFIRNFASDYLSSYSSRPLARQPKNCVKILKRTYSSNCHVEFKLPKEHAKEKARTLGANYKIKDNNSDNDYAIQLVSIKKRDIQTPEDGTNIDTQTIEDGTNINIQTPEDGTNINIQTPQDGTNINIQTPQDGTNINQTPQDGTNINIQTPQDGTNFNIPTPADVSNIDILAESEAPVILESYTKPALPPQSFTLQAFIKQSPTLQKLLELGVDLYKVQKRQGAADMILKMDFDRDIKDKIVFLHHVGVPSDHLGQFLTKNPHILGEDLDSLEVRISYLKSKNFSEDSIAVIVNRAPYFLCFSTESVDRKLGYFQQELRLTGDEVRHLITKCPQLVTRKISRIQENMFVIHNQLGFSKSAMKEMILKLPKLLITGKQNLMDTFDYIHNEMDITHNMFVHFPAVLRTRLFNIKQRDKYLRNLGLAQYDPKKPGYISLKKLTEGPDEAFCQQITNTSVEHFNAFLKTI